MTPYEIYEKRVENYRLQADILQKRENRLSWARLIVFFSGLILFVLLFPLSVTVAAIALVAGIVSFIWVANRHINTQRRKEFNRNLENINSLEIKCLRGDFSIFPDGGEYSDRNHPYTYDLDIFGHSSLFQYINRVTSKPAADMLAQWLKEPADITEIKKRQEAVKELSGLTDWRQKLIALGYENEKAGSDPAALLKWLQSDDIFINQKTLKLAIHALIGLGLLSTALVIAGLPAAVLSPALTINFIVYFSLGKKINNLHQQVSRSSDILQTYSETIRLIENESLSSELLSGLQRTFKSEIPVSEHINRLSGLVNRLDTRLNVLVSIPLNIFFFWDIHFCLALERWKRKHAQHISGWFNAMAEFEVLSSMGNTMFNNPEWVMPDIVSEYFILKAENLGHPLIPGERRICNSVDLEGSGRTMLVTGSNMSGKSTFLRTCGVNTVLALAGCPVCATTFTISRVNIWSSMRISDSLEDNTSSFYAELKRLASIIKESSQNQKVLLLLDEILRGTNSNDRYTGSVALIKQLQEYNTIAIVATHDLKLAELSDELNGKIDNYHFDVKINGEELYFDYKLTTGICKSLNASILMKKMGIKV